jgi:hopanoid biosynthesis associated protein HpnK
VTRLVVTADDFGLSVPVNEAVEEAANRGILTAASLMVGAPAVRDAVERARRLPRLGVGLHLALIDAAPVLPPSEIPDLVGQDGTLSRTPFRTGAAIFLRASVRRQAEAEVRAQFEAFRRTGLVLDHVNGHHHFHMHPSIFALIVRIAGEYGVRGVRVPHEPPLRAWRAVGEGLPRRIAAWLLHRPRTGPMKRRLEAAGVTFNDMVFGLGDSGHMTRERVLRLIEALPEGACEMYFHPAAKPSSGRGAPPTDYGGVEELEALVDPEVARAVARRNIQLVPFAGLAQADTAP